MSPILAPPLILIHKQPIHSNCFFMKRETPIPLFPACLSISIHHSCSDNALVMCLHAELYFLLIDSEVVCISVQAISSLTVYKPEDLCFASEFFLRFDHLLIVLFCLSSKFWILFSQQIFSFSLKSVSIPLLSSKKTLIKNVYRQSDKLALCLSAITLSN